MPSQQDTRSVRTEITNGQITAGLAQQSGLLRSVLERLDEVIQLLTPKPSDGPTLDELLAGLVTLVSDQAVLLKRIDTRTDLLIQQHLKPGATRPAVCGSGANGEGARG
jgi:uncharacterized protein YihD (DUF1040 family)